NDDVEVLEEADTFLYRIRALNGAANAREAVLLHVVDRFGERAVRNDRYATCQRLIVRIFQSFAGEIRVNGIEQGGAFLRPALLAPRFAPNEKRFVDNDAQHKHGRVYGKSPIRATENCNVG